MVTSLGRRITRPALETADRNLNFLRLLNEGVESHDSLAVKSGLTVRRIQQIEELGKDHWSEMLRIAEERGVAQIRVEASRSAQPAVGEEMLIPIHSIAPNRYQPRVSESLEDETEFLKLVRSIGELGQIHAITVRPNPEFSMGADVLEYELCEGGRRWDAFNFLDSHFWMGDGVPYPRRSDYYIDGVTHIRAMVREMEDREFILTAIAENVVRQAMSWSDETRAMERVIEITGMTHKGIGDMWGMSRSKVANRLGLLALPQDILDLIDRGQLADTVARDHLRVYARGGHIHHHELNTILQLFYNRLGEEGEDFKLTGRLTMGYVMQAYANPEEAERWRSLEGEAPLRGSGSFEAPLFDVDAFKSKFGREFVHKLPVMYHFQNPKREFTCLTEEWDEWQRRAIEDEARRESEEPPKESGVSIETADGELDENSIPSYEGMHASDILAPLVNDSIISGHDYRDIQQALLWHGDDYTESHIDLLGDLASSLRLAAAAVNGLEPDWRSLLYDILKYKGSPYRALASTGRDDIWDFQARPQFDAAEFEAKFPTYIHVVESDKSDPEGFKLTFTCLLRDLSRSQHGAESDGSREQLPPLDSDARHSAQLQDITFADTGMDTSDSMDPKVVIGTVINKYGMLTLESGFCAGYNDGGAHYHVEWLDNAYQTYQTNALSFSDAMECLAMLEDSAAGRGYVVSHQYVKSNPSEVASRLYG